MYTIYIELVRLDFDLAIRVSTLEKAVAHNFDEIGVFRYQQWGKTVVVHLSSFAVCLIHHFFFAATEAGGFTFLYELL
jgi:hypothetical protein